MPDTATVRMQTSDGKIWDVPQESVQKALSRGAKLSGVSSGGVEPWERRVVSGMGLDADKIASAGGVGAQWKETGNEVLSGIEGIPSWMLSILKDPLHAADPVANPLMTMKKAMDEGDYATAVGALSSAVMGKKAVEAEVPSIRYLFNKPLRSVAQFVSGVGKDTVADAEAAHETNMSNLRQGYLDDLRKATEEHGKKLDEVKSRNVDIETANQAARSAYEDKVSGIKKTYASKVADYLKKSKEASVKQTEAGVKGKTFAGLPGGAAVQRLYEMADTAADHTKSVYRQTKAAMDARWNNLRQMVGPDAAVSWEPVQQAVITAEDNLLKGSQDNIKLFREIMGKDVIGRSVPYEQARGFFTELGEKIQSQSIPGDVWRALNYVRDTIDDEIGKTNKAVSPRVQSYYENLKKDYSQYMQDFKDRGSALRNLVEATNPKDRVSAITGKEGANAIEALGRYTDNGANPAALGRVRGLFSDLRQLSSSSPTSPEKPTAPKMPSEPVPKKSVAEPKFTPPEEPKTTVFNPEEARLKILRSRGTGGVTPSLFWKYTLLRALMRKLSRNPEIEKWLSQNPQ